MTFRHGEEEWRQEGTFEAQQGRWPGLVWVDPEHPFHFLREGTGDHWFWNGTTTYQLLAWDEHGGYKFMLNNRRDEGICWYTGRDGSRILMKWYPNCGWNADLGGGWLRGNGVDPAAGCRYCEPELMMMPASFVGAGLRRLCRHPFWPAMLLTVPLPAAEVGPALMSASKKQFFAAMEMVELGHAAGRLVPGDPALSTSIDRKPGREAEH